MTELPAGTVTFLFTDIEGSTGLLHELGDAYADVLAAHRVVLREAFARHSGVEVDTQGDAFFVAFSRASDALAAAREAQAALDGPVRVRIGVHTGEPLVTDDGYVGIDVHRAARIAAAGHGGQVLVSQSTRDLVDADGLRDLGEHRLKDLTAPERIYQLGDAEFPPLNSLDRSNLPVAASPIVGRETELAQLIELLSDGARLVTIVGPGGTGKTRLAIQAAAELMPVFEDVWFVPLQAVERPELVLPTVAQTIGAPGDVAEHLRSRHALLVLDNFEHLLDAAADVGDMLARTEPVRILTTSRAPLRIGAERELPLEPLSDIEAAALFIDRARAAGQRVELDEVVFDVCRRVDRLPLAIELAAARTKLLDPETLRAKLDQRLAVLTGGRRDAPERQRTLRDTIAWSYTLLDPDLQRVFRQLTAFAGFSIDAAEAVCNATLDDLAGLVDASLVKPAGAGRFFILETIREYGLECLRSADEIETVRSSHAEYFRDLAEEAEPHLVAGSPEQGRWFARLEEERDNLRFALAYFAAAGRREDQLRLLVAGYEHWWLHGYVTEARAYLEDALGGEERSASPRAVDALELAAYFAYLERDHAAGQSRAQQMLAVASELGDDVAMARALHMSALMISGYAEREPLEMRALELLGDHPRAHYSSESLGIAAFERGDTVAAREYFTRCKDICESTGDAKELPIVFLLLAMTSVAEGDAETAGSLLLKGVTAGRAIGDASTMLWGRVWAVAAQIMHTRGESERALRLLGAAEQLRETGDARPLAGFTASFHERVKKAIWASVAAEGATSAWERGRAIASDEFLESELQTLQPD